jgi:hypothetical protein
MHPDVPWLTRQAVEILEDWLKPGYVGLEWGSGRSTLWFARRVSHLTSPTGTAKSKNQIFQYFSISFHISIYKF